MDVSETMTLEEAVEELTLADTSSSRFWSAVSYANSVLKALQGENVS